MTDIHIRNPNTSPRIELGPMTHRPKGEYVAPSVIGDDAPPEQQAFRNTNALHQFEASLPSHSGELSALRPLLTSLAAGKSMGMGDFDVGKMRQELVKSADVANVYAEEWRAHPRWYQTTAPDAGGGRRNGLDPHELSKGSSPLAKAVMDVGTQTNFA